MTTTLEQRRIAFSFDETTPLMWNPHNPEFAHLANVFSLLAVGLERFIVAVMRDAMPLINDQDARDEADGFLKQEARHAAAHVLHLKAIIPQYPRLQAVLDGCIADFQEIQTSKPLDYRLAFIASLEATFTPLFKIFLDQPEEFFEPGDDRVASLFLWHFIEEVEHRSSALIVFDAVVDNRRYLLRTFPRALNQSRRIVFKIAEGIDRVVPQDDRLVSARSSVMSTGGIIELLDRALRRHRNRMMSRVPTRELLRMNYQVIRSQSPRHDPEHQPLPPYAEEWLDGFERGVDVTRWFASTATD